jgi:hypothetical protein
MPPSEKRTRSVIPQYSNKYAISYIKFYNYLIFKIFLSKFKFMNYY